MNILSLILFIAAALVFAFAAFSTVATDPPRTRINLIALGLLLLTAAFFFQFGYVENDPITFGDG